MQFVQTLQRKFPPDSVEYLAKLAELAVFGIALAAVVSVLLRGGDLERAAKVASKR